MKYVPKEFMFKKGQLGNPNGRTKAVKVKNNLLDLTFDFMEVVKLANNNDKKALEALAKIKMILDDFSWNS